MEKSGYNETIINQSKNQKTILKNILFIIILVNLAFYQHF